MPHVNIICGFYENNHLTQRPVSAPFAHLPLVQHNIPVIESVHAVVHIADHITGILLRIFQKSSTANLQYSISFCSFPYGFPSSPLSSIAPAFCTPMATVL